jgi:hypothetical protein
MLSDTFYSERYEQEYDLSMLIFNFALEYAIRKIKHVKRLKLNEASHFVVSTDETELLSGNHRYYKAGVPKIF